MEKYSKDSYKLDIGSPSIKVIGIGGAASYSVGKMTATQQSGIEYTVLFNVDLSAEDDSYFKRIIDECHAREDAYRFLTVDNSMEGYQKCIEMGLTYPSDVSPAEAYFYRTYVNADNTLLAKSIISRSASHVIVVAGFGGIMGTYGSKWLVGLCRSASVPVSVVCTIPFEFEGHKKFERAVEMANYLRSEGVDIIILNAQYMVQKYNDLTFFNAFTFLDEYVRDTVNAKCNDIRRAIEEKMLGCLYGQAIGDALGLGTEFMSKDEVREAYPNGLIKYSQIIQDAHRCTWAKGAWTDDTDMMLCIMDGFENGSFNIGKVASNFKQWFDGDPKGIGSHIYKVLCMRDYVEQPEVCSKLWWDLSHRQSAANGALMRTSVIGLAQKGIEKQTEAICRLTHYDPRCVGSCVIAVSVIHNLVWYSRCLSCDEIKEIARKYDDRIIEWVDAAYDCDDISMLNLDEHSSIGYTLRTLSAALWCYWHAPSFESGLLSIVNEGGDADTNAAVSCAILGAKFGFSSIPDHYVSNIHNVEDYHKKVSAFIEQIK